MLSELIYFPNIFFQKDINGFGGALNQTLVAPSHHISQLFPAFVYKNIKNPRTTRKLKRDEQYRDIKDDVEQIKWSNFLIGD